MPLGVLITQCLQGDFVARLAEDVPVPGPLHIGHREARRLLGDDERSGPLGRFLAWAHAQPPQKLRVIHILDRHDPADIAQAGHLARFGPHCLRGTPGAELVVDGEGAARSGARFVDAIGLDDFESTSLPAELDDARRASPDGRLRVGVIGVWTDAKVTFLLYDLHARGRISSLATCSALTASASRVQHLNALDQLERLLDVRVEHAPGELASWLVGEKVDEDLERTSMRAPGALVRLEWRKPAPVGLDDPHSASVSLLSWLFRNCRSVALTPLAGGFSGAHVLLCDSVDAMGHAQVPSVVKLGPRRDLGQERVNLERVEDVLGNAAPSVVEFGDLGELGAVRFRFASFGGAKSVRSFQRIYQEGAPDEEIARVLRGSLGDTLMRLYAASSFEPLDVLADYEFAARWAPSVRARVEELIGRPATGEEIDIPDLGLAPNVAQFYERLDSIERRPGERHPVSLTHGDLNGQNVLVDGGGNVWIIDFGRLHRGHALRDFAKLENDVLYVMTEVTEENATQARHFVDVLVAHELGTPLTIPSEIEDAGLVRAGRTIAVLREIAASVGGHAESPHAALSFGHRVGLLRFAAHTLTFTEPTTTQRRLALYACGALSARIESERGAAASERKITK